MGEAPFSFFYMPFFFDERLFVWNSMTHRKRLLSALWANDGNTRA
jgi:hypothetical protein